MPQRFRSYARLISIAAILALAAPLVTPSYAQNAGNWHKESAQGFTEYSSQSGSDWIAIGCDDAATMDGSGTRISLEFSGSLPPPNSALTFSVDGETLTIPSDRSGGISLYQCPDCEQHLHRLLAAMLNGSQVDVMASDGRRASFPLGGFAALMTESCRMPLAAFSPSQVATSTAQAAAPDGPDTGTGRWIAETGSGNAIATGRADDGMTALSLACGQGSGGRINALLEGYVGSALAAVPGAEADLTFYFVRTDGQFTNQSGRASFVEATKTWIARGLPSEMFTELAQSDQLMIGNAQGIGVAKFSLAGSSALWQDLQATCRPVPSTGASLVARVQDQLNRMGYDAGPVDGAMGQRTRRAIIAFQKDHGIPATGTADQRLLDAIDIVAGSAAAPSIAPSAPAPDGQPAAREGIAEPLDAPETQTLLARAEAFRCNNRPDPASYSSGREFGYLSDDSSERYKSYSAGDDIIRAGGEQNRLFHLAGAGNDLIYVDQADAGIQIFGENGGDTMVVCGVGSVTPLIDLGPYDADPDLAIIDIEAFQTLPPNGSTIAVGGLNPYNDRLVIFAPPGAPVAFATSVVSVGSVAIQVTEGSPPFFSGTKAFDPQTVTVVSGTSVLHPPTNFHAFAAPPISAPAQTIRVDGSRAITLAGEGVPALQPGLACGDASAVAQSARPVDERFERTGGERSFVYSNDTNEIVFRDDALWQFLMAGSGDDRVFLFGAASGTHVEGGPGADRLILCDFSEDDLSVLVASGTSDTAPDADGDIIVLDPSTFAGTIANIPRRVSIGFEPAYDKLVLFVPSGLEVGYTNDPIVGLEITAGAAVIEVTTSLQTDLIDLNSVVLVPEGMMATMPAAAVQDVVKEVKPRNWSYGAARTLSGAAATAFEPSPSCQEVLDPATKLVFTEPSFVPTGAEYQPDQTYTRGDDRILLDGVQDWLNVHAGPGDDSIFLSAIGSDLAINGNSGADLIVLCSMRGLALTIHPGSRSVDIDPDTIVIGAETFRDVPTGMRRKVVIDGLNPVNDRLVIRVPVDLAIDAARSPNGSIQTISAGAVTIQASSSIYMDHVHVADAVTIVPATEE